MTLLEKWLQKHERSRAFFTRKMGWYEGRSHRFQGYLQGLPGIRLSAKEWRKMEQLTDGAITEHKALTQHKRNRKNNSKMPEMRCAGISHEKRDVILEIIRKEARAGRVYIRSRFAQRFEGKMGFASYQTIMWQILRLQYRGYIKCFTNTEDYGLPPLKGSSLGYMCVQGMKLGPRRPYLLVKPTHFKCPETKNLLPVADPDVWVYHDANRTGRPAALRQAEQSQGA